MIAKIKKWFIELILITLAISGCTRAVPVKVSSLDNGNKAAKGFSLIPDGLFKKKATVTPPGDYVLTMTVKAETLEGAKTRSYALHVPSVYDGKTSIPLMIMLHGTGDTSANFAATTGMNAQADQQGFIVVYPDSYGDPATWNPGFIAGAEANDVAFISEMIDHFLKDFSVDPKRIFVVGYFDGGMMAHKLAASMPEKITGIGVVGGTVGYQKAKDKVLTLDPALGPVSVIVINGVKDELVPYDTTKDLSKGNAGYLPASRGVQYWQDENKCDPKGNLQVKQNENIRITTFSCLNGTAVRSIAIWNGIHTWFDVTTEKKDKSGISATGKILEFLFSHPRP